MVVKDKYNINLHYSCIFGKQKKKDEVDHPLLLLRTLLFIQKIMLFLHIVILYAFTTKTWYSYF